MRAALWQSAERGNMQQDWRRQEVWFCAFTHNKVHKTHTFPCVCLSCVYIFVYVCVRDLSQCWGWEDRYLHRDRCNDWHDAWGTKNRRIWVCVQNPRPAITTCTDRRECHLLLVFSFWLALLYDIAYELHNNINSIYLN